jgi:hypothetical protein
VKSLLNFTAALALAAPDSDGGGHIVGRPLNDEPSCCSVFELRQYTLHPAKRDVLIELFEREFIEPQEAAGMKIVGQFIDLDDPNRFVWLRGFRDMPARAYALSDFYGGPVWKANREAANDTMIDSDNVLLLRPLVPSHGPATIALRPPSERAGDQPASLIVVTVYSLWQSSADAQHLFDATMRPELARLGVTVLTTMITESAENNFPRLPVREDETVFVWMARFESADSWRATLSQLSNSPVWQQAQQRLEPLLKSPIQSLRLQPTRRSVLR